MAFTRHGHHIYGSPVFKPPTSVARCGGPRICKQCAIDVANFIFSNKKDSDMHTNKYSRRVFEIDAVQVTPENMEEVATWCEGAVRTNNAGDSYVKVKVKNPMNEKHTRAYPGDWVSLSGSGYKVYSNRAFQNCFVQMSGTSHNVFEQQNTEPNTEELRVVAEELPEVEDPTPTLGANTPKDLFGKKA